MLVIKKMKNMKKLLYLAILATSTLLVSCKKYKVDFDQPTQVEFKPITVTLAKGTVAVPGTATILVQLVGPQRGQDLSIPYTIDAASTAVAGTDYTSSSTSGTLVIPANKSSVSLVITAIPANIKTTKKLILTLSDGGAVPVSQNYKTSTITIQ